MMKTEQLEQDITRAVFAAMREVGLDKFKKTSFFMSNLKTLALKQAA